MEIKYLGHSSFFIRSKVKVGEPETRLVTDPYDSEMVGLKFPKVEAEIVTVSHHHHDHDKVSEVGGNPLVIDWPGQFEKMGMRVTGFESFHDKKNGEERGKVILYKIEIEGLSVLHCGDLGVIPDDGFLDEVGEVDILMVPIGGVYTLESSEAIELVKKIEPSIVIPMHYHTAQQKALKELAGADEFLKNYGADPQAPTPKLVIKKEDLGEEMKVVLLEI